MRKFIKTTDLEVLSYDSIESIYTDGDEDDWEINIVVLRNEELVHLTYNFDTLEEAKAFFKHLCSQLTFKTEAIGYKI
jgi:hypothetical protein